MANQYQQFKCKRCKEGFKNSFSLKRHNETIADCIGHYFTCKRCMSSFNTLDQLNEHQLSDTTCVKYVFENKIQLRNRVVTEYNVRTIGFKPFIREILTPVQYDKSSSDTKLNYKLISLVYDSLSKQQFIELIKYASAEVPDLKMNLMSSLQQFILETSSDEKVDIVKQFYLENRSPSFD